MAVIARLRSPIRNGVILSVKAAALVAEIAALAYVAVNVVEQAWPTLEDSVGYALESEMSEEAAAAETPGLQPATEGAAANGGR
jgi:hypothetical protein